ERRGSDANDYNRQRQRPPAPPGAPSPPAGSGQGSPGDSPDEWSPSPRNQQFYNESARPPPDGPDERIAGAPAAAAGTAAAALCLRFPAQCAAAAYLLYEGLKNAFDAIVEATRTPTPTTPDKGIARMGRKDDIRQIDKIVREFGLSKQQRRILHDEITGQD